MILGEIEINFLHSFPVGNYMFKVNNRSTRTRCEICSKLTVKIPEQRQWCRFGIFIVNFEHISHLVLDFLLLTLNMLLPNGLILEVKFDGNPSLNFEGDEF